MTEVLSLDTTMPSAAYRSLEMRPGERINIDPFGPPFILPEQNYRRIGLDVPTVAEVVAGSRQFHIIDTRDFSFFQAPFLLIDDSFDIKGEHGFVEIDPHYPVSVGRSHHTDRFTYNPYISRTQFTVTLNGLKLAVQNKQPLNPTLISGEGVEKDKTDKITFEPVRADFTSGVALHESAVRSQEDNPSAPYGSYGSFPIIGRRTPSVKNGVYYTVNPRSEAVVVDTQSKELRRTLDTFMGYVNPWHKSGAMDLMDYLKKVDSFTRIVLPYKEQEVDQIAEPLFSSIGLINLSEFIKARAGVCRHQCLLAAYLMESLIEKGLIRGSSRVERNIDNYTRFAHAWAVFQTKSGKEIVVDPAQKYVGPKEKGMWNYTIPDDL